METPRCDPALLSSSSQFGLLDSDSDDDSGSGSDDDDMDDDCGVFFAAASKLTCL